MQDKEIEQILNSVKASPSHPLFYPRVFALVSKYQRIKKKTSRDKVTRLLLEDYEELSRRLDRSQIQEACAVRNVLHTRQLAQMLIDDKGEIHFSLLPKLISYFQQNLYSLGPQRQYDGKRQEHILKVLQQLLNRKDLAQLLKKITKPISNPLIEDLIRQTLQLPAQLIINDVHTKQAVVAAWLCYLRQNVGSCFATAPAEIIHDEQADLFLQDLVDLISTGRLKRTFGGIENIVPLSQSWGGGDLKKPLLIQKRNQSIYPEIWYSPGLLAAFKAAGFLATESRLKEKIQQLKNWIQAILQKGHSSIFQVLTAEQILRSILLHLVGVTEKQLKEYESRPKPMMQAQLVAYTIQQKKNPGNVSERCSHFLQLFEIAKNAFKSLADNALLKAWEFTLASFSDIKYEFARWNFYASLGLGTNEPGGIGQCIYQTIQNKLDQANQKVQEIQYEYEAVYTQVKTLEARMRHASTEQELQWLRIDYQSRANEFYFLQEQRDSAQHQASALVDLYDILYKIYVELFKDYFQEIYDADMQEVTTGPFDDSPAGFRLLYKHGRNNPSQWTIIKNQQEFIDSLVSFFVATEPQIAHQLEEKKIQKDLSDVVTIIINHVKTEEFLKTAFHRMAAAHHTVIIENPLENLDKIEKKPWVYTSGGTMNTLVSCYYRLEDKPKEIEKWVESEMELLVYLADTMKNIPQTFLDPYMKGKCQSILMQSPTHAFLLKPLLYPFKDTWFNEEFTYTFIRDQFVRPAEMFIENLLLNTDMLQMLIQQLSEKIPENFVPRFKSVFSQLQGPLNPIFLREYLVEMLANDRGLRYHSRPILSTEEIDGFLYSSLPLLPVYDTEKYLEQLLKELPGLNLTKIKQILSLYNQIPSHRNEFNYLSSQQLQNICKALLCLYSLSTTSIIDYHLEISSAAQKLGLAMPKPIIFADTNWVRDMFGFVVNPGTGKLELWRIDYTGSNGYPMSSWKQWVDGSRPDLKWGVYVKPFQYGQS